MMDMLLDIHMVIAWVLPHIMYINYRSTVSGGIC